MATTPDGGSERIGDDDRRARLLAAFALSLACHALGFVVVRGWRAADPTPVRPLVVTMVARDGGAAGSGADAVAGRAPGAGAASVAAGPVAPGARAPLPPSRAPAASSRRFARAAGRPARLVARPPAAAAPPDPADAASVARGESPAAAAAVRGGARHDESVPSAGGAGAAGAGGVPGAGSGGGADGPDGLRALCASCPAPDYPPRARRQGWQGSVDVALAIGADGGVIEARVGRSSGYPALDEVALDVARRSRFRVPAGGAELRGRLRYRFVLDATAGRR